jgi:hypothetical protein
MKGPQSAPTPTTAIKQSTDRHGPKYLAYSADCHFQI